MIVKSLTLILALVVCPAAAETLVAKRTLKAQTILSADDIGAGDATVAGAARDFDTVVGLETRVAIYQGRPIFPQDLGPPAVVERNQAITLSYRSGIITILAEGRALGRGGVGDRIRVMNMTSRSTVIGLIRADGSISVEISN
ncbi:MAG: flagellar basal body P-ring formation chaperone FlgA [Albidovulum sp.]|jgi:flagella basal body P-ring formation protein FlgA